MKIIRGRDTVRSPWKNGGGTTREIARFPSSGPFEWRLSQASVIADGPFSLYPGCERWLTVIDGAGIFLNDEFLPSRKVTRFSGDIKVECRVAEGKVEDLGLIYDPKKWRADMSWLPPGEAFPNGECTELFVYVVEGSPKMFNQELGAGDTLWIEAPPADKDTPLMPGPADVVIVVRLVRVEK